MSRAAPRDGTAAIAAAGARNHAMKRRRTLRGRRYGTLGAS